MICDDANTVRPRTSPVNNSGAACPVSVGQQYFLSACCDRLRSNAVALVQLVLSFKLTQSTEHTH